MEQMPVAAEVRRDREREVFELVVDDEVVGYAPFREEPDGVIVVPYVEVDRNRRGEGLGEVLADGLLGDIRAAGEKVVPTCGWLAGHVRANAQHHDLLASRS